MKQVIVVRRDLKLRRAEIASCVARASSAFIIENIEDSDDNKLVASLTQEEKEWFLGDRKTIVLGIQSEDALRRIIDKAEIQGLNVNVISKRSFDEKISYEDVVICVAIGPHDEDLIDEVTGNLKLV